jgi:hypothetical protein
LKIYTPYKKPENKYKIEVESESQEDRDLMDIQQEKRKQDPHMMVSQITPRVMHLSSKLLNS